MRIEGGREEGREEGRNGGRRVGGRVYRRGYDPGAAEEAKPGPRTEGQAVCLPHNLQQSTQQSVELS